MKRVLVVIGLAMAMFTASAATADLASRVERVVKQRFPAATVEVVDPMELKVTLGKDDQFSLYLDNLVLLCRDRPEDCDENIARRVDSLAEQREARKAKAARADVRAVIKPQAYLDAVRDQMRKHAGKEKLSAEKRADSDVVSRPFMGDMRVVYVVDRPISMQIVTLEIMKELGLTRDELHVLALKNLESAVGTLTFEAVQDVPGLYFIVGGDGYDASRVLLHGLWKPVSEKLGGALVVAAPSRDTVLFARADDRNAVAVLKGLASRMAEAEAYGISGQLLLWTERGWTAFE